MTVMSKMLMAAGVFACGMGAIALTKLRKMDQEMDEGRAAHDMRERLLKELAEEERTECQNLRRYRGALLSLHASQVHYQALFAQNFDAPDEQEIEPASQDPESMEEYLSANLQAKDDDDLLEPGSFIAGLSKRVITRARLAVNAETGIWLTRDGDSFVATHPRHLEGIRVPETTGLARKVLGTGESKLIRDTNRSAVLHSGLGSRSEDDEVFDALGIQPETMICAPVCGSSGEVFAVVLMVNKFCWRGGASKVGPRIKGWGGVYSNVFDCLPSSRTMGNMVDAPSKQPLKVGDGAIKKLSNWRRQREILSIERFQVEDLVKLKTLCDETSISVSRLLLLHTCPYTDERAVEELRRQASSMCTVAALNYRRRDDASNESRRCSLEANPHSGRRLSQLRASGMERTPSGGGDSGSGTPDSPWDTSRRRNSTFGLGSMRQDSLRGAYLVVPFLNNRSVLISRTVSGSPYSPPAGRAPSGSSPATGASARRLSEVKKGALLAGSRRRLADLINPKDVDEPASEPQIAISSLQGGEDDVDADDVVTRWRARLSQLGEAGHAKMGAGGEEAVVRAVSGGSSNESGEEFVQEQVHTCICGEWCTLDGTNFSGRLASRLFWGFDASSQSDETLERYAIDMFVSLGFVEMFDMDLCRVGNFVRSIRLLHNDVVFHNFKHAFNDMMICFLLLKSTEMPECLKKIEQMACLIAAMSLHLGHTGYTNEFLVATGHDAAKLYNDQSVQEQLHCSLIFQVLLNDTCNLLHSLSTDDYKEVKKTIINGIISQEMKGHASHLTKLRVAAEMMTVGQSIPFKSDDEHDRQFIVSIILKGSSLAKQTFKLDQARFWASKAVLELEPQATLEKLFGLSCRCLPGIDAESRSEFQLQFVQYQIMPFWACVSKLWPELRHACIQLERNLQYYEDSLVIMLRGGNTEATVFTPKKRKEILGRMVMTTSTISRHSTALSGYSPTTSAQDGGGSGSNDDSQDFSQWMPSSAAQTFSNQSSIKISRPKLCSDLAPDEDQAAAARQSFAPRTQQRRSSLPAVLFEDSGHKKPNDDDHNVADPGFRSAKQLRRQDSFGSNVEEMAIEEILPIGSPTNRPRSPNRIPGPVRVASD